MKKRGKPIMAEGNMTFGAVLLHRDGKPLTAGELTPSSIITFNAVTGEVYKIRKPRARRGS